MEPKKQEFRIYGIIINELNHDWISARHGNQEHIPTVPRGVWWWVYTPSKKWEGPASDMG